VFKAERAVSEPVTHQPIWAAGCRSDCYSIATFLQPMAYLVELIEVPDPGRRPTYCQERVFFRFSTPSRYHARLRTTDEDQADHRSFTRTGVTQSCPWPGDVPDKIRTVASLAGREDVGRGARENAIAGTASSGRARQDRRLRLVGSRYHSCLSPRALEHHGRHKRLGRADDRGSQCAEPHCQGSRLLTDSPAYA